jgi:MFS family permease
MVIRTPAIAVCAVAVVAASATISMLEPVLALHLRSLGIGPARVGATFGVGAVASTLLHPIIGRLADRWGARRLMLYGLVAVAASLLLLSRIWSFESAILFFTIGASATALIITPSLTFMGEATSAAGIASFGVAYGLYNMAWGAGLLGGPALSGFLYERMGLTKLAFAWAPGLVLITVLLERVELLSSPKTVLKEPV